MKDLLIFSKSANNSGGHCSTFLTLSLSRDLCCVASLPFTNPLPWPHGIVKCPLNAQLIIFAKVVVIWVVSPYGFMNTVNSDIGNFIVEEQAYESSYS